MEHTGWYPDYQLRLFKKGKGKFLKSKVHEPISIDGGVGEITSPLLHENYQTINQFLQRLIIYTDSESKALVESGYKFSYSDVIRMPFQEFLRRFFNQKGYLDGIHGLALSMLMAFYHLIIFLKIWELNKFKETENSLDIFAHESKQIGRELKYWIYNSKKEDESNPAKKLFYKTRQKL